MLQLNEEAGETVLGRDLSCRDRGRTCSISFRDSEILFSAMGNHATVGEESSCLV